VVTGATRGIGRAMATAFEEAGAELLLTGTNVRTVAELNARAEESGRSKVRYAQVDFDDPVSTSVFLDTLENLPRLDVLVNNAGVNRVTPMMEVSPSDYAMVLDVNLHAPYRCSQVAARKMVAAGYGRILNVASIWSVITKPGRSAYTVAKAGLVGFTRSLAVEVAKDNVIVNAISPGFTSTELTRSTLSPDEIQDLSKQVPIRRFADPMEMARVALFLTSKANSYMTGQNIVVDGGFVNV